MHENVAEKEPCSKSKSNRQNKTAFRLPLNSSSTSLPGFLQRVCMFSTALTVYNDLCFFLELSDRHLSVVLEQVHFFKRGFSYDEFEVLPRLLLFYSDSLSLSHGLLLAYHCFNVFFFVSSLCFSFFFFLGFHRVSRRQICLTL